MTRDDIIRMATEAGLWPAVTDTFPSELQRFAALVAAAEREACAKLCEEYDDVVDRLTIGYDIGYAAVIRTRSKT